MFRKGIVGWLIALLVALTATVGVFAAQPPEGNSPNNPANIPSVRARGHIGQITAIGDHEFTLKLLDGKTVQVQVDENTRYRVAGGGEGSFADLAVGRWVAGRARPVDGEQGVWHARVVVLLPEDFDPSLWKGAHRYVGKVTAVGSDSLTVETRDGQTLTFAVTGQTRFRSRDGAVKRLDDLKPDMLVMVVAKAGENGGNPTTLMVAAGKPGEGRNFRRNFHRYVGKVTAVGSDSLTVETRDGQTLTFAVTDQTRFRSRDGAVKGLDDLKPDMLVMVVAKAGENGGNPTALMVAAGKPGRWQHHPGRGRGRQGGRMPFGTPTPEG